MTANIRAIPRTRPIVVPRLASVGATNAATPGSDPAVRDGVKYTLVQPSPARLLQPEVRPPLPPKTRRYSPLLNVARPTQVQPQAPGGPVVQRGLGAGQPTDVPAQPAARVSAARPRLVAPPFSFVQLSRAHQTLKRSLPEGFDRTIQVGQARFYRVRVGVGRVITIDAIHRPGTRLLLAPGGAMWLNRERITPSSDAPTRRMVAERINMAGRLMEAVRRRQAARSEAPVASPARSPAA